MTAHRERAEKAASSPESMWKLVKWARTRECQPPSVTPAIKCPTTGREVTEASAKAELFRDTFFPPSTPAELGDTVDARHTDRVDFPRITEKEVEETIQATHALKAPGPDGIPNKVLQIIVDPLAPHLTAIFNQSIHLGHCPTHFRASNTIVLRKPGKDDYTAPKAYRPIALLNNMGKIMDAVLARRLSYLVEKHHVLPHMHMGGRKQRSTEHALHTITESMYRAWDKGQGTRPGSEPAAPGRVRSLR